MTRYLYFWSEDCGTCKEIMNSDLWETKADEVEAVDVYTEHGKTLANKFQVRSLPSMVEMDSDGNVKSMQIGSKCTKMLERV